MTAPSPLVHHRPVDADAAQARSERLTEAQEATRFRSILDRTPSDTHEAIRLGYNSVAEWQIDELGKAYRDLLDRVKKLEAHAVEEARYVDDLPRAS